MKNGKLSDNIMQMFEQCAQDYKKAHEKVQYSWGNYYNHYCY